MQTTETNKNSTFIINLNEFTNKTLFKENKIWLTKKEILNIYSINEEVLNLELDEIIENTNLSESKIVTKVYDNKNAKKNIFYSIDIILLLGYKSKKFKETRFLVNTNNFMKKYNKNRKHRFNNLNNNSIENIINYFNSIFKII